MSPKAEIVRENYSSALSKVAIAAQKSGRSHDSVRMIGVTKYHDSEHARWLVEAGCTDLAESRPQSLWDKADALKDLPIRWHLIGHLQRNKAKKTLPLLHTMHSLDSLRLLQQLQSDSAPLSAPIRVLVELNLTSDASKTGLTPADAKSLVQNWVSDKSTDKKIQLCGLMGMSTLGADEKQIHEEFESLRAMRDAWQTEFQIALPELSMGMSDDFEIAIEHGSTMVRLGSILFRGC